MKKLVCVALAVFMLLSAAALADSQLKLMQAKQIPKTDDVRLYVNADEAPTQDNMTVYMNGALMDAELSVQPVLEMDAGTVYVFCVDVSGTINNEDLDAACDEMIRFCGQLGEADLMRVYVIGSGATPICDYTRDVEVVTQALNSMPRRTDRTYLWEALRIAADDLTANRESLPELAQIIVFSDCVDDSNQTGSVEQTLASVQQAGMPLRVVLMNSKEKNADLSPIEWLCEQSGGVIFDGRSNFASGLEKLHGEMDDDYCVTVNDVPFLMLNGSAEWYVQQRSGKEMHASNIMSCELSNVDVPDQINSVSYAYTGDVPENAPGLPSMMLCRYREPVELAAAPSMEGYTFSGWSSEDVTIAGNSFTMPNANVAITGSWTANRHRVVYSYAGSVPENAPELPEAEVYSFGETVAVAGLPEMEGYTFSGWGQTDFAMPDSDVVVSGVWIPNRHRVRYSYSGIVPDGAPALPESSTYNYGDAVPAAAVPTMVGYTFGGWDMGNFNMPDTDVTITGEWLPNQHQVTYSYTGTVPENAPAPEAPQIYSFGETVNVAGLPEMEGYTFQGWSADGIEPDDEGGFTLPDADVAFTGLWQINRHDVRFAYDDTAPENAPEIAGESHFYAEMALLPTPIMEGYTFQGWTAEGVEIDENGLYTVPDSDLTFTGSWAVNVHAVSSAYTGDVPEGAPEAPATGEHAYGETVTLEVPEMEDYAFGGWTSDDVEITGNSFTMPDGDVTLTGEWSPKPLSNVRWVRDGEDIDPASPLKVDSDDIELRFEADGAVSNVHFTATGFDGEDITDSLITVSADDPAKITVNRGAMEKEHVYTITGTVEGLNPDTPEKSVALNAILAEKSKLWLFVGIGAGVLLLAALLVGLLSRRKKDEETPEASIEEEEDPLGKTIIIRPDDKVQRKHVTRRVNYIETLGDDEPSERSQVITDSATIGRDPDCEIFYKGDSRAERTIGHKQAKLTLDSAGHLFIEPHPGTTNPTLVDGKEIDERTAVEPGSEIQMGDVKLKVQSIGSVEKN